MANSGSHGWARVPRLSGAIRQSEVVLSDVNRELALRGQKVQMGEISYLAVSLHMFMDRGDRRSPERL